MSSLVLLNSRDAHSSNSTNEDFNWIINNPRFAILFGYKLGVEQVEIPNAVYPVNEYYNKVSVLEGGGATLTVTMTSSNYTGTTIATHLAAILTTASAATGGTKTYTGTYDSYTKKITIASTGTFAYKSVANDAYELLGISTLTASVAASVVADNPVNLSGSAYVDIITNFSSNNWTSGYTSNVLERIPLTGSFGDVIQVQYPAKMPLQITGAGFTEFRCMLRDDRGNPWKLPSNMHISLVLRVEPLVNPDAAPHSANNANYATAYSSIGAKVIV